MFDRTRLKEVLVQYKQSFVAQRWGDEKYKWEAVKWFQDNWDVNAPNFTTNSGNFRFTRRPVSTL